MEVREHDKKVFSTCSPTFLCHASAYGNCIEVDVDVVTKIQSKPLQDSDYESPCLEIYFPNYDTLNQRHSVASTTF